ncbi:SEC14L1 [Symbiodinium sp. CCMP2592]|nr:SEC14L1 [Symbiodinium sp. CCMP2592]
MDLGTKKRIERDETVCRMFHVLVGAHVLDGNLFSVPRLWDWFVNLSNQDVIDCARRYENLEEAARDYVATCPRYLGRSPSYVEFGEEDPEEQEKDVPGPYLRMRTLTSALRAQYFESFGQ